MFALGMTLNIGYLCFLLSSDYLLFVALLHYLLCDNFNYCVMFCFALDPDTFSLLNKLWIAFSSSFLINRLTEEIAGERMFLN